MAAKKNIPWKIGDSDHHGLDLPHILHYIDFELTAASSTCIEGRFIVSKKSMQVWEVKFFAPKRSTEGSSSQDLSELKSSELRLIALSKLTATILPSGNEINSKDKRGFPSKL
eukprot:TRINITY_DN8727_c0_g1_i2.p1 TRINITY_DN8727_c0_g1~~TRINITY_DN8727_c0_g1_i2.p1  ORF type:complete len:113 (+),score=15.56 TRINITY_DN8727_c0_g1_i2:205-543(+)